MNSLLLRGKKENSVVLRPFLSNISRKTIYLFWAIFLNQTTIQRESMSLLKQIDDKGAVLAWSPLAETPNLVALGTKVMFLNSFIF